MAAYLPIKWLVRLHWTIPPTKITNLVATSWACMYVKAFPVWCTYRRGICPSLISTHPLRIFHWTWRNARTLTRGSCVLRQKCNAALKFSRLATREMPPFLLGGTGAQFNWISTDFFNRVFIQGHWKCRSTKHYHRRARLGNHSSCCSFSLHFLCDILPSRTVHMWVVGRKT